MELYLVQIRPIKSYKDYIEEKYVLHNIGYELVKMDGYYTLQMVTIILVMLETH